MFRPALLFALLALVLAGCNSSDNGTPFKTSASSPAIELPPGVKVEGQKETPKGDKKPDPKKESN